MRYFILFLCFSCFCFSQTREIVFTEISEPKQKDIYPLNYWKVWVNDLPRTETVIKNPNTSRRVRVMEYFNRFLIYAKMQTNESEELLSVFEDSFKYSPHYTVYRYHDVLPLRGKEYRYMWKMYKNEKPFLDSICAKVYSSYNSEMVELVKEFKTKDQRYRKLLISSTLDELKADGSWQKQLDLDEENSKTIKQILDKHGYPGRSIVGYENESAVFLVIQHSNLELMEYGLPFVQKAIRNLDLDATYYAYLYDRIQLVKDLPQLYGTQYNLDGTLYKLSEPEDVNKRREVYGLQPIKI
ncbi:MAG: hypothetical protein EVB11_10530 [Winogradskyella sp.]|nr:MAG: hypothetical protein EVB11_10530 [Winogradskyella sp.]